METTFATDQDGKATPHQLEVYSRTTNTLRRLLETLGIERRPKDVTPTLDQYLRGRKRNGRDHDVIEGEVLE
jgi:hypothetical protein